MPPLIMNQLWTLVSAILAVVGVVWVPSDAVKATAAAGAALVVAVIQWQQHRTIRHYAANASAVAVARVGDALHQDNRQRIDAVNERVGQVERVVIDGQQRAAADAVSPPTAPPSA